MQWMAWRNKERRDGAQGPRMGGLVASAFGLILWFVGSPLVADQDASVAFRFTALEHSYRFAVDGSSTHRIEAEIHVLGPAAIQQLGQLYFPYVGDISRLEVQFIQVLKPDGRTLEASRDLFKDLDAPVAPGFPIYSARRVLHVTTPPFEVGDRIRYRIDTLYDVPESREHIGVLHSFQSLDTEREILRVEVPVDIDVRYRAAEGLVAEIEEVEGHRRYTWKSLGTPDDDPGEEKEEDRGEGIDEDEGEEEDDASSQLEVDVVLSSAPSWAAVGEWYRSLSADRAEPTDELRRLVHERLEGVTEPREKVLTLHRMVTTEIRYLSLLLERGRYQPRLPSEILETGFGDCKDKHSLLAALLEVAGFKASGVLVNLLWAPSLDVPTELQFNHIITYVELEDGPLWLDSTAVAPAGYLAPTLRGESGLLVPVSGEPRLVEIPVSLPYEQSANITTEARIDEHGALHSENVFRLRGDLEIAMRAIMLSAQSEDWRHWVTGIGQVSGLDVEPVDPQFSDAMAIDEPLEIRYAGTRTAFLFGDAGGEVEIDVPLPPFNLYRELPEGEDGELDLEFILPTELSLRLELPGVLSVEIPPPVEIDYEHFSFDSRYELETGDDGVPVVRVAKSMRAKVRTLEAAARSEYQAFRRAVRKEEGRLLKVVLANDFVADAGEEDVKTAMLEAVEAKDWPRAESLARQLTEQEPDEAYSWAMLARILKDGGKEAEAVEAQKKVVDLDRFYVSAYFDLGVALWNSDQEEAAVEAFREQLKIDPLHTDARANLGRLLGSRGAGCDELVPLLTGHEEAVHAYDWVLSYLAPCLYEQEETEKGAEKLEQLRGRTDTEAIYYAAWSMRERGFHQEALKLYRRVAELVPEHSEVYRSIGWTLELDGDLEGAKTAVRQQLEIDPSDEAAMLDLGRILFGTEGRDAAIQAFEDHVSKVPENLKIQRSLGLLYYDTADPDRAREPLELVYESDAEDFDINRVLGLVAARQGRYEDAKRYLEKAKALDGERFEDQDMLDYALSNL